MSVSVEANQGTVTWFITHSCYYKDTTAVMKCKNCLYKVGCNEYCGPIN